MARKVANPARQVTPPRLPRAPFFALALWSGLTLAGCEKPEDLGCGPRCEQNSLVTCDVDGDAIYTPCGEARCAADSPVPQCVPADALPCDSSQAGVLECLNGRALMCNPDSLYQVVQACPEGELCQEGDDNTPPACIPVDQIECLPGIWVPLCIEDTEYTCKSGDNRVITASKRCPAE
jgi:hypothetical protein